MGKRDAYLINIKFNLSWFELRCRAAVLLKIYLISNFLIKVNCLTFASVRLHS